MKFAKLPEEILDDAIEWWKRAVLNQHSSFGVMVGLKITALAILFGLNPDIFTRFLWVKITIVIALALIGAEVVLALILPHLERENAWKGIGNTLKGLTGKKTEQEKLKNEESLRYWFIGISVVSWSLIIIILISKVLVS